MEDTGKGIKPEFLPYLFDRFSQEDSSSTRPFGGLGLGLAIVKSLVEMQGGTVRASSPGEGKGTTFIVTLPSASAPVRQEGGEPPIKSALTKKKRSATADVAGLLVLVIDDQEDTQEAFSTMLQSSGEQTVGTANAAAGLLAVDQFEPDVVLCDIAMPREDGFVFIRKVRALKSYEAEGPRSSRPPHTPVTKMSGGPLRLASTRISQNRSTLRI